MKQFVATFYSHFGAIRFKKELDAKYIPVRLGPVPRNLSSSCGTCAFFSAECEPMVSDPDEIEQIVCVGEDNG